MAEWFWAYVAAAAVWWACCLVLRLSFLDTARFWGGLAFPDTGRRAAALGRARTCRRYGRLAVVWPAGLLLAAGAAARLATDWVRELEREEKR